MFTLPQQKTTTEAPVGAGLGVSSPATNKTPFILLAGMSVLALASVGAGFYGFYLQKTKASDIENKKQELLKMTLKNDVSLEEMTSLSNRIKGMSGVFSNAPSAHSVFTILEDSAEKGVSFSKLSMERVENAKSYNVTVTGVARSLEDLYLERNTLQSSAYAKYISGASVTYDWNPENGQVDFTIKFLTTIPRFGASNLIVDITKPESSPEIEKGKPDLTIPISQAPQKPVATTTKATASTTPAAGTPVKTATSTNPISIPQVTP